MDRAQIRRWLVVVLAVLAAASMFPSFGGSPHRSAPPRRHATLVAKHPADRPANDQPHFRGNP